MVVEYIFERMLIFSEMRWSSWSSVITRKNCMELPKPFLVCPLLPPPSPPPFPPHPVSSRDGPGPVWEAAAQHTAAVFNHTSQKLWAAKNVSYDAQLCPIIAKGQRAPNAQVTRKIVDRHYEELTPVVTGQPFFHLFYPHLCLFCRKGKSLVLTAQPFFVSVSVLILLVCWESILIYLRIWRQVSAPSPHPQHNSSLCYMCLTQNVTVDTAELTPCWSRIPPSAGAFWSV